MEYDIFGNPAGTPAPSSGDFSRGLKQSFQELKGTGFGLLGLVGAGANIQGLKDYGLENANAAFEKSAAMGKETDKLEGIESFGDGVDWLQHGLGYVAGQAIPSVVTGGIGAMVAKKLAQKGIQSLSTAELQYVAAQQAARKGAIVGSGAASYGQSAGAMYPDMVNEGHDEPGRAALYAIPSAALDILPEARLVTKLFPLGNTMQAGRGIVRRTLAEGGKQAALEALTEGAQTVIEREAAYKPLNDKDAWSGYANSMALGALGGGVIGGATGALSPGSNILPGNPGPTAPIGPEVPPGQWELPLDGGTGGTAPLDFSPTGPVDPRTAQPAVSTQNQPDLFGQVNQYQPTLQGQQRSDFVSPTDLGEAIGSTPPPPQQIQIPNQPQPSGQGIIAPVKNPDTRTAYGIAAQKQQRGELLTPYETFLANNPPEAPPIEVAQDRTVPLPSKMREQAVQQIDERGYKMTNGRFEVASAAEDALASGSIGEGEYDQIHTLLAESKLAKAKSILFDASQKQEKPNVPTESKRQEAPLIETPQREVTPAPATVQEVGRQDAGLLKPTTKPTVKPVAVKPKADDKLPAIDKAKSKEVYDDNWQEGEPAYDSLSDEDARIWDDKVSYGEGTIEEYDKFQRRVKKNAIKEKQGKPQPDDADLDIPSIKGTIRKGVDILRKAPPNVLSKIKVKREGATEEVSLKEAVKSIDDEIDGYKLVLKCVG